MLVKVIHSFEDRLLMCLREDGCHLPVVSFRKLKILAFHFGLMF